MGTKRSWEGQPVGLHVKSEMNTSESANSILSIFENFRSELDEHHDRRERIIKTSRDITALSKKIIFALQRVRATNAPIPPKIAKENQTRLEQITTLFTNIVPDLQGINAWRYRSISSGIQEYIEAIAFEHYLRTQTLITHGEVCARVPTGILVTEEDYLLGLFDLTGEMMRFAVLALSSGNASTSTSTETQTAETTKQLPHLSASQAGIVFDLRAMRASFEELTVPRKHNMLRDLLKKVEVMQNSVEKVERAAYGILVRGSERPSGWTPDLSVPVEVGVE
ncbi:hypothetical protein N7532_002248 [Penicillium argentinense]|uniref:Translin n=1 Tax=Penicillium argentinense TaxID=1131581 RepID=A0A9W9KLB1_9EURO|nr:uncharacterized protein N7532_002248 [Penicillium argentinense]KAJ5109603.1 hypothetical protein N7532_002248 [Penicillium argentinense]